MEICLLDDKSVSSNSLSSQNIISNGYNLSAEKVGNLPVEKSSIMMGIFSQFFYSGIESLQVSLLGALFMIQVLFCLFTAFSEDTFISLLWPFFPGSRNYSGRCKGGVSVQKMKNYGKERFGILFVKTFLSRP